MCKTVPSALAVLLALTPLAARAQTVGTVTATADPAVDRQIAAWLADPANSAEPDETAVSSTSAVAQDRSIHGEAEIGMGSNGYRGARVAAAIPVGEDGELGVAAADESFGGRHGRADQRSFAVSLRLGEVGGPSEPCGLRHSVRLSSDLKREELCSNAAQGGTGRSASAMSAF